MHHETDPPSSSSSGENHVILISTDQLAAQIGAVVYTKQCGEPCYIWPHLHKMPNRDIDEVMYMVTRDPPNLEQAQAVTIIMTNRTMRPNIYPFLIYLN